MSGLVVRFGGYSRSVLVLAGVALTFAPAIGQVADGRGASAPLIIPAPTSIEIPPDGIVAGTLDGVPTMMLVVPNGLAPPLLHPAVAERLGINSSIFGAQARVGPVEFNGEQGRIAFTIGPQAVPVAAAPLPDDRRQRRSRVAEPQRQRVIWFERPFIDGFDLVFGPQSMPQDIVTFRLRAPQTGEVRTVMAMTEQGSATGSEIIVGGERIFIVWDLRRASALATATAGSDIAAAHGGALSGETERTLVAFGVERPARRITLSSPVVVGPFRLTSFLTRVADYGNVSRVPDADQDASEIVVRADVNRGRPLRRLALGQAEMSECSSLTFDKPAREIILTCMPH